MASVTLIKSSFCPKKAEWGATRQAAASRPVTVAMAVRPTPYADELVQTAVWYLNTDSIILRFVPWMQMCILVDKPWFLDADRIDNY
jgi:hypothetical protein